MELRCGNCGNRWASEKSDLAEYESGPRCTECRSRDVEAVDGGDEPLYAVAFRRFEQGDTPLDLCRDGLCDPDRARELAREYSELSEYRVVSEEKIEQLRREAYQEGKKAGERQANQRARQRWQNRLEQARQESYQQGYSQGMMASFVEDNQSYPGGVSPKR